MQNSSVHVACRVAQVGSHLVRAKMAILISLHMQYIPCSSTFLAQETLFLTPKHFICPKISKKCVNRDRIGLIFSSESKFFGTTSSTLVACKPYICPFSSWNNSLKETQIVFTSDPNSWSPQKNYRRSFWVPLGRCNQCQIFHLHIYCVSRIPREHKHDWTGSTLWNFSRDFWWKMKDKYLQSAETFTLHKRDDEQLMKIV